MVSHRPSGCLMHRTKTKQEPEDEMKAPRESTQASRKGNGPAGMMAETYVAQNDNALSQEEMIAVAAYYRAEKRGFAQGKELDDWLQAEAACNSGRDG